MQIVQANPKRTALFVFALLALAIAAAAMFTSTARADTTTGVNNIHRVHVVKPERGTIIWHVVIVRSGAHTTAVEESIEEGGGVGGNQLRMYYHTNDGAIEKMRVCGRDTSRYPFCLAFSPSSMWTYYWPDDELWFIGFRQDYTCSQHPDSVYYCKYSQANYATHDLRFPAEGKRSIYVSKGFPQWTIYGHGGAQTLKNTRYTVHD